MDLSDEFIRKLSTDAGPDFVREMASEILRLRQSEADARKLLQASHADKKQLQRDYRELVLKANAKGPEE